MSRIMCPTCSVPMFAETIGATKRIGNRPALPGRVVSYCQDCNLVLLPGDVACEIIDFPRSSDDRRDSA